MPYTVGMADRIGPETRERIRQAWPTILADIAAGELVGPSIAKHGLSNGELRAWRATEPGTQDEWEAAREASADAFADMALQVASSPAKDAAHARTYVDTLKWAARTRNPRRYGEKQQVDLNVRTIDLTRIIADANARLSAARQQAIEGEVLRQALPAPELDALL